MTSWIKNFQQLATTELREQALQIAEAGLQAIDTEKVIQAEVRLDVQNLRVKNQEFDLSKFDSIKVIGFGKASCKAAYALEQILRQHISSGVAIGLAPTACELIQTYQGSHPSPSEHNVQISEQIYDLSKQATEKDLVIVIVSGGGSALLCYPLEECRQAQLLYEKFLPTGGTIQELNVVRKHLSLLKGGGLAQALYPATVLGLIFSDVPGEAYDLVASGPTYKDTTTMADAQAIIDKYQLGKFQLNETPTEDEYFERVTNIPLVSNQSALEAMAATAEALGLNAKIISSELYDEADTALEKIFQAAAPRSVVLAGGEVKLPITTSGGTGGRGLNLAMRALKRINQQQLFLPLASDGLDNSDAAGAIVDHEVQSHTANLQLNVEDYIARFDGYTLFQKLDSLIFTGPTEANVSDLLILIQE